MPSEAERRAPSGAERGGDATAGTRDRSRKPAQKTGE